LGAFWKTTIRSSPRQDECHKDNDRELCHRAVAPDEEESEGASPRLRAARTPRPTKRQHSRACARRTAGQTATYGNPHPKHTAFACVANVEGQPGTGDIGLCRPVFGEPGSRADPAGVRQLVNGSLPDATTANVHHNLSKILFEMGRAREAEESLLKGIPVNPDANTSSPR